MFTFVYMCCPLLAFLCIFFISVILSLSFLPAYIAFCYVVLMHCCVNAFYIKCYIHSIIMLSVR